MAEQASDKFGAYLNDINELLEFEFGSKARIQPLHVPENSVASNVISDAKLAIPAEFYSVWISHSLPEVATYESRNLPFSIICLSQDHLFYYDKIRWLFNPIGENETAVNSSYLLYKIIGEFALKYSDPDKAVLAYIKAFDGNPIYRPDVNRYANAVPFKDNKSSEFICLLNHLHEMGHNKSYQRQFDDVSPDNILAEAALLDMIHDVLYPSLYPDAVKEKTLQLANVPEGGYGFSLTKLKEEIIADFHAASGFLRYLQLSASRSKEGYPDLPSLLHEYAIYPFLVGVIQRCKFNAQFLDSQESSTDKLLRADLQDIAMRVRLVALIQWQHEYVHRVVGSQYTGNAHQRLVTEMLNEVQKNINHVAVTINSEMRKCRIYCIQLQEQSNELQKLESCRQQIVKDFGPSFDLEEFCMKANSFHKDGRLLRGLNSVIRDPHKPLV